MPRAASSPSKRPPASARGKKAQNAFVAIDALPVKDEKFPSGSFFGVYMLVSLNDRYSGRTYIGFTVDPTRRLRQHNAGHAFGGAVRTSSRGPWAMVLIVHGFPNMISALRFEWAWQHPKRSRRLAHVANKKSSERMFDFNIRLLSEMLNVGPWNRLPLTVQWLRPDIKFAEFPPEKKPPGHMNIVRGSVEVIKASKKQATTSATDPEDNLICAVCIEDARLVDQVLCPSAKCGAVAHLLCLAEHFAQKDMQETGEQLLLPVEGRCPVCDCGLLWGDVVRNRKARLERLGCLQQEEVHEEPLDEDQM